jgi:hypothetical protein
MSKSETNPKHKSSKSQTSSPGCPFRALPDSAIRACFEIRDSCFEFVRRGAKKSPILSDGAWFQETVEPAAKGLTYASGEKAPNTF